MSPEANAWANDEHDRLICSVEWAARYPSAYQRDGALARELRFAARERFGAQALDFRWRPPRPAAADAPLPASPSSRLARLGARLCR